MLSIYSVSLAYVLHVLLVKYFQIQNRVGVLQRFQFDCKLIHPVCFADSFVNFSGNVGKVGLSLVSALRLISELFDTTISKHLKNVLTDSNFVIMDLCRYR